ncbi:MAG: hypothetical protein EBS06_04430 [Proteobacteria bacterium]|nr:hypothetical protein [Pseudomonadota bacterium]
MTTSNSSTSSFKDFIKVFLITSAALLIVITVFLVTIDPFNFFNFHSQSNKIVMLPFKEEENPINDRYAANSMIKSGKYDSAIFGSSVSYILENQYFNKELKANFANLSMRAALPYEQILLAEKFVEFNPNPKFIIFFITMPWCDNVSQVNALRDPQGPIPEKEFTIWLIDKNPLNEIGHIFNLRILQYSIKKLYFILSGKDYKLSNYDLYGSSQSPDSKHVKPISEVRKILYRDSKERLKQKEEVDAEKYKVILNSDNYGRIDLLYNFIKNLPDQTVKILIFSPRHYYSQPSLGSYEDAKIKACKSSVLKRMANIKSLKVIDFLIDGIVTRNDQNFWDGDHFNYQVARQIIPPSVVWAIRVEKSKAGYFNYYSK